MNNIDELWHSFIDPITPNSLDENEWYSLFITCLTVGIVIYLHKKHQKILLSEALVIVFLNIYFAVSGDHLLAVKPVDLYDTIDHDSGEMFDLMIHGFTYPATLYIFMHFYFVWGISKIWFVPIGAAVLTILDWVSMQYFHLFTYKAWKIYYSYPFYILVLTLNLNLHSWIRKRYRQERSTA